MARRKTRSVRAAQKSMKLGMDDLKDMVKAAVKEAMDEGEESKSGEEETGGSVADIIEAAVEAVNEKRKSDEAAGFSEDDVNELLDAIAEAEEGKADDDSSIEEILRTAVESVNEKRKSAKSEEISEDDLSDILDAIEETMSDDSADEEEKARKAASAKKEKKAVSARKDVKKTVERKYSNIYMPKGEEALKKEKKQVPAGIMLARCVKCIDVLGKNDPEKAAFFARKYYGDTDMEREFKALTATGPENGGYLIPEVYMDQIIEMLYPKTVIFELGAQKVPLEHGNLNIPKMTAGTRATWSGEQRKIKTTGTKFGNIKLSAKRLSAIVPMTRELMMSTSYSSDALFANDLTRRMQLGLDYGGLYGTGGEFMPLGVYNNEDVEKVDVKKLGDEVLADAEGRISADFPVWMRSKALQKNIDDASLGWAFNSLVEGYLMNLKTSTGAYIYREEMNAGKLLGAPYKISNQIPLRADGTTEIFFGNWSDLLIGDQMGMETYTTLDGVWTDEEGVQHSAFDENLAATRATMYDDIAVRHGESFIIAKNVKPR